MSRISLNPIKAVFSRLGHQFLAHNRMIYFTLFVCVLIGAILGLNLALYQPSDDEYRTKKLGEAQSARFDTETIKKIQSLNAQQQTTTLSPPSGQRINPFGE